MKQFTMTRRGMFELKTSSSNQCKGPGHKRYNYIVISCCDDTLDDKGFVIDHMEVDKAVKLSTKKASSCENLCKDISEAVYKMLKAHGTTVRNIRVEIEPAVRKPVSKMEYAEIY